MLPGAELSAAKGSLLARLGPRERGILVAPRLSSAHLRVEERDPRMHAAQAQHEP